MEHNEHVKPSHQSHDQGCGGYAVVWTTVALTAVAVILTVAAARQFAYLLVEWTLSLL